MIKHSYHALLAFAVLLVAACDDGVSPVDDSVLTFDEAALTLGEARVGSLVLRNSGSSVVGPIEVIAGPVRRAGLDIPGASLVLQPEEIATLSPGGSVVIAIEILGAEGLQPGSYSADVHARVGSSKLTTATVSFDVPVPASLIGSVQITDPPATIRQGDVLQLTAVVFDTTGAVLDGASVDWSILPAGAGLMTGGGEFVPYATGTVSIVARAGDKADTAVTVVEARGVSGGAFSVLGRSTGLTRITSDLWLHGGVAYTGTWGGTGNTVYVWDITGNDPALTDSVRVVATTVNDVKIRADGQLAVLTHEGGAPHAVTLLEMSDPLHPTVVGEYFGDYDGFHGVHNVWIEGDYLYLVVDGSNALAGLWILDVSDPSAPERVARFYGGSSFLHDVYVRNGLAFLSHWDAGLIILDVGNGIRGGSPTNPVEVSRVSGLGGQTHNAWYWPEAGYVFVGEEDTRTPGRMHVVDARDLLNPVEVGSFRVSGDTPHNFWLDEERAILYMAWYTQGLQAIDVSGRLLGSLDQQGRLIAASLYDGPDTDTWAPQLHDGFVFVSDMNSGIWKLQPNF